jgi:hypothetical protein
MALEMMALAMPIPFFQERWHGNMPKSVGGGKHGSVSILILIKQIVSGYALRHHPDPRASITQNSSQVKNFSCLLSHRLVRILITRQVVALKAFNS